MNNQSTLEKGIETNSKGTRIEVEVQRFPVVTPKFDRQAWASGEGGGEGEG